MNNEELDIVQTGDQPDDAEQTSVNLDETDSEDPKSKAFMYDDDEINLVATFMSHPDGQDALKEISRKCRDDYQRAWDSTEEYRERKKKNWEIFIGNLRPKVAPMEDAANVHIPLMLENTSRNLMRMYSELFDDWNDVFGVAAIGPDDETMAQILTLHGNWQIREQIIDFKRQQWRGMTVFVVNGDVTSHSYYDPQRQCNRHDMLTIDDFVVPYTYTSMMPDWSDVPYRIKIMRAYQHELEARRDFWQDVDAFMDDTTPTFDGVIEQPAAESVARDEGIEPTEVDEAAPFLLLWYEGWLDLPNQTKQRFCKVICDAESDKIFELTIHEHQDWQDQQRYDAQRTELDQYRADQQQHELTMQELERQKAEVDQQISFGRDYGAGDSSPEMQQAIGQYNNLLQGQAAMRPPQPPAWVKPTDKEPKPAPVKKVPIHLFAHGVALEPIIGNLGIGYGQIQADHNRAANTAMSQFTDAATGANLWNVFVNDMVEFQGGDQLKLGWGKIIRCAFTGDDIRKAIMQMKPDPANPQLLEVVKMVQEVAASSMQSPDVLSGAPGKSGEPFRGIMARIEQATKQLSVLTRKYADFLERVLKNNALLNSIYLNDDEFFQVALRAGSPFWNSVPPEYRQTGAPQAFGGARNGKTLGKFRVGRLMYARNYHVEIRSDLRFTTQSQKIQEADELVMMGKSVPILQNNVRFNYHAVKKALLARGHYDMIETLGPDPMDQPALPQPGAGPPGAAPGLPPGAPPPGGPPQGPPQRPPPATPPRPVAPPAGPPGAPPGGIPGPNPVAA